MTDKIFLVAGILAGLAVLPLLAAVAKMMRVEVEDEEVALVTRFGKLVSVLKEPGWHWLFGRMLPHVNVEHVSLRRDFRHITNVHINDARGTTVVVDVFLEYRIVDPVKATFEVADWDRSLRNVVSHAVISILGDREFKEILCDRTDLGERLKQEIDAETGRWGLKIEFALIRNVSLLPEVSQQLFHMIAARLERAKAHIEEEGHQRVALLEAQTSARVSELVADAKAQYAAAVGRAYSDLKKNHEVFSAYEALYELSLLKPQRTIAFKGFGDELRSADAAMLAPPFDSSPLAMVGAVDGASARHDAMVAMRTAVVETPEE
jgi:regulator of protease activity HflC (stomatin/prohibitin superfamily)